MIQNIHINIANDLVSLGGHLECTVCGYSESLGAVGSHLANGWPKHCGYTMTWITKRQESGEECTHFKEPA